MTVENVGSLIKSILVLAIVICIGWFVYSYKQTARENERLSIQVESLIKSNNGYKKEIEQNIEALTVREEENKRMTAEKVELAKQLQEVINNDESAKAWANANCPDGVYECLLK